MYVEFVSDTHSFLSNVDFYLTLIGTLLVASPRRKAYPVRCQEVHTMRVSACAHAYGSLCFFIYAPHTRFPMLRV